MRASLPRIAAVVFSLTLAGAYVGYRATGSMRLQRNQPAWPISDPAPMMQATPNTRLGI